MFQIDMVHAVHLLLQTLHLIVGQVEVVLQSLHLLALIEHDLLLRLVLHDEVLQRILQGVPVSVEVRLERQLQSLILLAHSTT
jgi:hypothetical protein